MKWMKIKKERENNKKTQKWWKNVMNDVEGNEYKKWEWNGKGYREVMKWIEMKKETDKNKKTQ